MGTFTKNVLGRYLCFFAHHLWSAGAFWSLWNFTYYYFLLVNDDLCIAFYLISLDFFEIFPATLSLLLLADLYIVYCCELLHPICSKLTFVGATFPHNICRIWTVKTHFKIAFCEAAKPHLLYTKHNWADCSCYEFKLCNDSDWNFWKCI